MSIHQYTKPIVAFKQMIFNPEYIGALIDCFHPLDTGSLMNLLNPEHFRIKNGWKTLNKHLKKLPMTRFHLLTHTSRDNETTVIGIVDKVKLIQTVSQYRDDFQQLLEALQAEPNDLLDDRKLRSFLASLHGDQLIGTLLGYGRENAFLFNRYRKDKVDPVNRPMIGAWQEFESDYLEQIARKNGAWTLADLFYPTFVCDPNSSETAELKKVYREDRENILTYFEGKDLVGATLSLLCRP